MISVEARTTIRYLHAQGVGIRAIATQLGLARNTVRAAIRAPDAPTRTRAKRPNPHLAPFSAQIAAMLFEQRYIGSRILRELETLGYRGGPTALYAHLAQLKAERASPRGVERFETGPGEQAQFDWSPYQIPSVRAPAGWCSSASSSATVAASITSPAWTRPRRRPSRRWSRVSPISVVSPSSVSAAFLARFPDQQPFLEGVLTAHPTGPALPLRAVLDLAASYPDEALRAAFAAAVQHRCYTLPFLRGVVEQHAPRQEVPQRLAVVLATLPDQPVTRPLAVYQQLLTGNHEGGER